ncbi:acyl-CoA synthetase (AMP-forming)/AMP-acid ligase II [Dietzia kunjamensis]|uniref:AMP-binding protein n=1 Tax=Dietzia kunjamensis TaxID=322509 RepID=UPI000E71005A|nr:AMP-binding protein [Dietzia kunjamensis]MBB1012067.1 AMP-binding protein [Dietzia kunjamensis]RKE65241.1 acyl-CoA synthetase (AMP-forming)/AMP-acid ligase II [Dietzia kunjamensis]
MTDAAADQSTDPLAGTNPEMNEAAVFEAVADKIPDNLLLTMDGVDYTYRQIDELANRMGHLLKTHGAEPQSHIALYMKNSAEHMAAIVAAMKIRVAGINVNYRYTPAELVYLFNDSQSVAVLVDAEFAETMAAAVPKLETARTVLVVGGVPQVLADACAENGLTVVDVDAELPGQSAERDFDPVRGDDHWIVYTGGTTGFPKGVQWHMSDYYYACLSGGNPYGDKRHSPQEVADNVSPEGGFKIVISAPLMHGAGLFTLLTFVNLGGHLVMFRDFDAEVIVDATAEYKAQLLMFVGDGMAVPITDALLAAKETKDFSAMFMVASGGGIWSKTSRDRLIEAFPNVIIRDNFGASETGNDGEMNLNEQGEMLLAPTPRLGLIDESNNPIAPGSDEIGYIVRRGHVPLGYWNDPEKTARTFPEVGGQRVAVLGDMGQIREDGTIVFLGRGSGCINTGGEKVFPEEVEQALKAHPAVHDALVAGAPDERYGQKVAAVVSFREGMSAEQEELSAFLRESLANYKVPKVIVDVPEIRRSPAGKADYKWAKERISSN